MSNYGITVDTGGRSRRLADDELLSFFRNAGIMQSALESMKGSVRGLRGGFQGAARCLARMGLAARGALSALMDTRNVVDGLRSGMKNLYAWSRTWWKSFAGTLHSLAGNAVYLRNSLAAMAAPMLKALAPAIEFVTDKFVGLFNLINQFFARLTGAGTYVAAKRVSGSIDGVGASASHASNDVKELRRQLTGFDELNVLSALDDDSGGGSGGGSGGSGGGVQFEERQIDGALAGFVDSLKSAFDAGDWQQLGTLIGAKINEMVESVDWAAAGSKVGYYVNGLFSTTYWTLETVNFTNIGASVAEFLNSALAGIDFTTVGATVALLFTSLAETIAGFVDGFDWKQFAEKLADGLNGFTAKLGEKLDAVDWGALALKLTEGLNAFIARADWANAGKVFAGRVNDLLEILGTASAGFDWKGAGAALATAVNNLFKNVDWEGLGNWLNNTLQGVLDFGIAFFQGFDAKGFADGLGRALERVDWKAVSEKLWTLFQTALKKLGEIAGALLFGGSADVKLNLGLLRDGWKTLAGWLGIDQPLSALIGLLRDNWQSIARWLGLETPVQAQVGLVKSGWTSLAEFIGTVVTVLASLVRADDSPTPGALFDVATALGFKGTLGRADENQAPGVVFNVGTVLGFLGSLARKSKEDDSPKSVFNSGTVLGFLGTLSRQNKDDDSPKSVFNSGTVLGFLGTLSRQNKDDDSPKTVFNAATVMGFKGSLSRNNKDDDSPGKVFDVSSILQFLGKLKRKDDKYKPSKVFNTGSILQFLGKLKAQNKTKDVFDTAITITATLSSVIHGLSSFVKKIVDKVKDGLKDVTSNAEGGVISGGGRLRRFARGGIISGGVARYLSNVPHYAGGTTRAHGTVFVAGEAGPEIMGHINGRTEILNKSQLAQTMYSAVLAAMTQAVGALGTFLSGQLANCTNAIVGTMGNLAGVANIRYHEPVMASGTVLPYDVAAQVARTGADIQGTLDANNEDLIQTIISVIGAQTSAIVSALRTSQQQGAVGGGLTARQIINDINRRAQMFGSSPLLD